MNERIKELRKALGLTQQEFADKLGISRNNIATYETRKTGPGNSVIKLICNTFSVSEKWLRDGEGDIFLPKPETAIDELVRTHGLDNLDRQIILEFIKLKPDDREAVKKYVRNLAQHIQKVEDSVRLLTQERTIDQKAAYMELAEKSYDSEQEQASQAPSAKESDVG